ncbi:hypothetical protein ACWC5I_22775 [Kitasatospora sp. NPDC001574]
MKSLFMASFVAATAVEIVVVVALLRQVWRQRRQAAREQLVVRASGIVTAASVFGGSMTVAALVAHGWEGLDGADTLLYAVTFGIVTAALVERIGNKSAANLAYVLPAGFGVLAGLVANAV